MMRVITEDGGLFAALAEIKRGAARGILTKAMRIAVKPVPTAMKAKVPQDTGLLRRFITQRVKFYPRQVTALGMVGPRSGGQVVRRVSSWSNSPVMQRPGKYAHLVEKGTKPHSITIGNRTIKHPGTKAQPFLESTGSQQAPGVSRRFYDAAIQEYYRAWDKAISKGKSLIQKAGTRYSRAARGYVPE